jgi:hypothetical protein
VRQEKAMSGLLLAGAEARLFAVARELSQSRLQRASAELAERQPSDYQAFQMQPGLLGETSVDYDNGNVAGAVTTTNIFEHRERPAHNHPIHVAEIDDDSRWRHRIEDTLGLGDGGRGNDAARISFEASLPFRSILLVSH